MLATFLKGATAAGGLKFISSSINQSAATANTVTAPTGVADGDLLIAFGFISTLPRTVTLPTGFTSRLALASAADDNAALFIATKVASSESGDYTFSWSGSGVNTVVILVYRNATDTGRLIGAEGRSESTTVTAPSISPTIGGALIAFFAVTRSTNVSTGPSGMLPLAISTSEPAVAVYGVTPNGTGATGNKTLVWDARSDTSGIQMQIYGE